jgi:hypothetical protein
MSHRQHLWSRSKSCARKSSISSMSVSPGRERLGNPHRSERNRHGRLDPERRIAHGIAVPCQHHRELTADAPPRPGCCGRWSRALQQATRGLHPPCRPSRKARANPTTRRRSGCSVSMPTLLRASYTRMGRRMIASLTDPVRIARRQSLRRPAAGISRSIDNSGVFPLAMQTDGGHGILPIGGHESSPRAAANFCRVAGGTLTRRPPQIRT